MFNYVCEVFFWCCVGIWMVLLVVYGWSLAGGCLGGGGMACCERSKYGLIFQWCVASARTDTIHINTRCQTILHACGPWHLQRFSCPGRHDLDKEKAASVACDEVSKCKISSKKREWQPKRLCIFQGKRVFSCAFSTWLNSGRFYANASASSGSRQAKVQATHL